MGDLVLADAGDDEPTLIQVSKGIDAAFEAEDRNNPEEMILDGDFYLKDAWNARGGGYSGTVTPEGWRLFAERLQRAQSILEDVYARTPREPGIARCMLTAVLGEQLPRDQMELWFQRGQDVEGNLFNLYMSKRWYLLPRWYGSDQDVWAFGLECAKSTNWPAKIPIMLAECISDRAENDPTVFADPEVWQPLEKTYRQYLSRYPRSEHYRSLFALSAAQGGHWDVAKEQLKILGADWDRAVFPGNLYAETLQKVNAH